MQQPSYQQQTAPRLTLVPDSDARPVDKGFRQASIALDIAQLLHDANQTTMGSRRESIYGLPQPERLKLMRTAQAAIRHGTPDALDIAYWAAAQRIYEYELGKAGKDPHQSIWEADPETQRRCHYIAAIAAVAYQVSLEGMDAHAGLGGSAGTE